MLCVPYSYFLILNQLLSLFHLFQFAVYEEMKLRAESYYGGQVNNQVTLFLSISTRLDVITYHANALKTSFSQHPVLSMTMGALSKIIASTITYPYQVVKSRLQQRESGVIASHNTSTSIGSEAGANKDTMVKPKYENTRDCMSKIWR
jgi:hypothetical protein